MQYCLHASLNAIARAPSPGETDARADAAAPTLVHMCVHTHKAWQMLAGWQYLVGLTHCCRAWGSCMLQRRKPPLCLDPRGVRVARL